jgi:hypothetical protein
LDFERRKLSILAAFRKLFYSALKDKARERSEAEFTCEGNYGGCTLLSLFHHNLFLFIPTSDKRSLDRLVCFYLEVGEWLLSFADKIKKSVSC